MENQELKPIELLKQNLAELKAIIAMTAGKDVDVETLALQELEYIRHHALTNPQIAECLPQTIVIAVRNVLKQNLTMDPYAGLVYIKTRNINIGSQDVPIWKKALEIQPSGNGLISINRQCGRILDIKRPEVQKDENGKVIGVSVDILVPSVPAPRWETIGFDEDDIYRWRRASHRENAKNKQNVNPETLNYANENYTNWKGGIDPEFARAKALRHALKKRGTNPNEKMAKAIVMDDTKTIILDHQADQNASGDESQYHEVVETTPNYETICSTLNSMAL